jgi:hypothetical protein
MLLPESVLIPKRRLKSIKHLSMIFLNIQAGRKKYGVLRQFVLVVNLLPEFSADTLGRTSGRIQGPLEVSIDPPWFSNPIQV